MLVIDQLTVRDRRGGAIVHAVSLSAAAGEILAVVGPDGAGKTAMLEGLVGLRPAEGIVRWHGERLEGFKAHADTFSFMPDDAVLPEELTVRGVLGGELGRDLGLDALWERGVDTLSGGEAKRVWLAWTLARDRPVMVLDEPFEAFDPVQLDAVLETVRQRAKAGVTVVASIHQMSTAELIADRIALVADGRIVAVGTLDELRARAASEMWARTDTGIAAPTTTLEEVFRALIRADPSPPP